MAKWFTIVDEREESRVIKFFKFFTKSIIGLVVGFILLVVISGVVGLFFEDKITARAVEELNKNLLSPIKAEQVELSLIKKFPYASIELKNVSCGEVYSPTRNLELFSSGSVFLQFNIWDLLFKKYSIKKIALKNANVQLYKDSLGVDNWHFWKEKNTREPSSAFEFSLTSMTVEYADFQYENQKEHLKIGMNIRELNLTGKLNENQFKMSAELDGVAGEINIAQQKYGRNQSIKLATTVDVNENNGEYAIKYGKAEIDGMVFTVNGAAQKFENTYFTDFKIEAKDLNAHQFLSTFNSKYAEQSNLYEFGGELSLDVRLKGPYGEGRLPGIRASMELKKGFFNHKEQKLQASEIEFKGQFIHDDSTRTFNDILLVNQFQLNYLNSIISGELKIKNLQNPYLKLRSKSKINLNYAWLPTQNEASGLFTIDLSYSGRISSEKEEKSQSSYNSYSAFDNLYLSAFKDKGKTEPVTGIVNCLNEDYEIVNDDGYVSDLDVYIQWAEYEISTQIISVVQNMVRPFYLSNKSMSWSQGRASFFEGLQPAQPEPNAEEPEQE